MTNTVSPVTLTVTIDELAAIHEALNTFDREAYWNPAAATSALIEVDILLDEVAPLPED